LREKRAIDMRLLFIGDIVGKPGRETLKKHLRDIRARYDVNFVIANYENVSHGFGLTQKNADELLDAGVDMMTGGNHSFDKKEIFTLFDNGYPLIRPINYPDEAPGKGLFRTEVNGVKLAVLNVMGSFAMPMTDNPFTKAAKTIKTLRNEGYRHIVVDMHAEASAEKFTMLHLFGGDVSAILGTHTHVGTDDLQICDGCCYVTDVGLTGCRDGVIGMDAHVPMRRALTGVSGHHDIPKTCKTILQAVVFTLDEAGRCIDARKLKIYDDGIHRISDAFKESL
jgi:metallophosphoesterase (TIGR00282 family)